MNAQFSCDGTIGMTFPLEIMRLLENSFQSQRSFAKLTFFSGILLKDRIIRIHSQLK